MVEEKPEEPKEEVKELSEAEKVKKETEELKTANDGYDVQKLRATQARAEKQRGGESNAGQEEVVNDPDQEMADKLLADSE